MAEFAKFTYHDKKLSCRRNRAMIYVTKYFAKSLNVTLGHSK